jgi:O-antigen ligase
MGLSSALDWWDEWKLRVLVLCSLFVQFLLFFSDYVRQRYALRRLRVLVWIAYIGGDALAIYALATLFNRQKQRML